MRLSIIIIEYHCMQDVITCIESIEDHLSCIEHETVVISNSCYNEAELQDYQEKISLAGRLISTNANLGYAGGVNAGLNNAAGDYIYILNPDCLLKDSNIVSIIGQMEEDPEWAISGPMVSDVDGNVQPSCRRFPKPWTFLLVRSVLARLPWAAVEKKRYLMTDLDRNNTTSVDWVSGGALLVKASSLRIIGGMDERYFLYMEDVDWCRSAWESGFKVKYCPESEVIHAGQHRSINPGLKSIADRHLRWHLTSMFRYFVKFGLDLVPNSEVYSAEHSRPV